MTRILKGVATTAEASGASARAERCGLESAREGGGARLLAGRGRAQRGRSLLLNVLKRK